MSEPLVSTKPDPNDIYFPGASYPLYTIQNPDFPKGDKWCEHNVQTLQRQRSNGVYALCLADRIHLQPSPSLTIALSQRLCGRIREHVTHVWTATSSNAIVVAKFYDPLYFHDSFDYADPIRLATWSVASEVRAYEKLQSLQGDCIPQCLGLYATALPEQEGRTVYVPLLEHVTGKDLRYLCEEADEREKIVADFLCEKHYDVIFSTIFRLAMDFFQLGVSQSDLALRNTIIGPSAGRGPFCSTERCPARHEIDADDVQAVMVDFERVLFCDPIKQSTTGSDLWILHPANTFQPGFATYVDTRSCLKGCSIEHKLGLFGCVVELHSFHEPLQVVGGSGMARVVMNLDCQQYVSCSTLTVHDSTVFRYRS